MILALEILLTASAWRKGWGPRALIPLAATIVGAFLVVEVFGPTLLVVLLDLACVAGLIAMQARGPSRAAPSEALPTDPVPQT